MPIVRSTLPPAPISPSRSDPRSDPVPVPRSGLVPVRFSELLSAATVLVLATGLCLGGGARPASAEIVYFGFSGGGPVGGWRGTTRRVAPSGQTGPAMLIRHLHGLGYHQIVFGERIGRHVGVSAIDPAGRRVQLAVDRFTGGIVEARILGPAGVPFPGAGGPAAAEPARTVPDEAIGPGTIPAHRPARRPGNWATERAVPNPAVAPIPRARPAIVAAVPPPVQKVSPKLALPPPPDPDAAKERAERDPLVVY